MKIALYDENKVGVVRDGAGGQELVDVSAVIGQGRSGQETMERLISDWEELRTKLDAFEGPSIPLESIHLRAPIPRPINVLGMRVNFKEGTETAGPLRAFSVSPGAILDPGGTTVFPAINFLSCRHEAELVCVIGKRTENVPEEQVMDNIFGYTAGVDIGIFHRDDWGPFGKSCTGFKPIGPWIVTKDEIPDPESLQVRLTIDGGLRQDYNTCDIAHPVSECVSWLSTFMTLMPGDLLFMGTNHQQVGPLQHGDSVQMSIERIGAFQFNISDPMQRTWDKDVLADIGQRAIREKDALADK